MVAEKSLLGSLLVRLTARRLMRQLRSQDAAASAHAARQLAQIRWGDASDAIVEQMKRRDAYKGTLLEALEQIGATREQLIDGCLNWLSVGGVEITRPVHSLATYGGPIATDAIEEKRKEFVVRHKEAMKQGSDFMGSGPTLLQQSLASTCRALHGLTGYVGHWQSVAREKANDRVPQGHQPISATDMDLTIAFIVADDEWLAAFESYGNDQDICVHFHVANEDRQRKHRSHV